MFPFLFITNLLCSVPRAAHDDRLGFDAPVTVNDVVCTGSEESLMDCSLDRGEDFVACEFVAIAQCEGIYLNTMGCYFLDTNCFWYHDTWFSFPVVLFTI